MNFRQRKSFTLLELLVVVAIIAVITGVAVAAFNNFSRTQRLAQAAKNLETILKDAQGRALSSVNGLNWGVHLEVGSEEAVLFSTGSTFLAAQESTTREIGAAVPVSDLSLSAGNVVNIIFSVVDGTSVFTADEGTCLGGSPDGICAEAAQTCIGIEVNLQGSSDKRYLKVNDRNIFETNDLTTCP